MHRCLKIPEILLTIFQNFPSTTYFLEAKCLVSLACTCRDFHAPALDLLWYTLEDLVPLLRIMPDDLVRGKLDPSFWRQWSFSRPLVPSGFERFDYYAPRVKVLTRLSISIDSLTLQDLLQLSSLAKLTDLRMILPDDDMTLPDVQALDHDGVAVLPALLDLHVVSSKLANCTALIQCLHRCTLESINLTLQNPPSGRSLGELFMVLSQSACRASLQSLMISAHDELSHSDEDIVYSTVLAPLLLLRSLYIVVIDNSNWPGLDGKSLQQMVLAWPRLCYLHLYTFELGTTHHSLVTLEGLLPLAAHCPNLCTINLGLHASFKMTESLPGRGVINRNVKLLDFGHSTIDIDAVPHVAGFLSDVFPCANIISTWDEDEFEEDEEDEEIAMSTAWDEVISLHPVFVIARHQERFAY
ncbi:hypothetical protein JAAARDRAFT_189483 [Jaapia argillacea MUCL 33604]|uniref:F-box domain-containing protein n=1 Tax=Jaapia argillacea MUCL 33604 TaxID=933084 RepID=A0A067QHM8_9AGAM|nr:hypothetical protein JAAARDRAFT_189483 [Jaapia argillacea MUCL 33604]